MSSSQNKLIKDFTRPEASRVCHSSIRARPRRSNASLIMRRLEEVSLQPVRPPASQPPLEENDPIGLPSYEEAIAKSGQHDAPPPPYPGYVRMRLLVATFTCAALTSYAHSWTFGSHWNLVLVPVTVQQRKLNKKTRMFAIKEEKVEALRLWVNLDEVTLLEQRPGICWEDVLFLNTVAIFF